jgi:hypothetical protein
MPAIVEKFISSHTQAVRVHRLLDKTRTARHAKSNHVAKQKNIN